MSVFDGDKKFKGGSRSLKYVQWKMKECVDQFAAVAHVLQIRGTSLSLASVE